MRFSLLSKKIKIIFQIIFGKWPISDWLIWFCNFCIDDAEIRGDVSEMSGKLYLAKTGVSEALLARYNFGGVGSNASTLGD